MSCLKSDPPFSSSPAKPGPGIDPATVAVLLSDCVATGPRPSPGKQVISDFKLDVLALSCFKHTVTVGAGSIMRISLFIQFAVVLILSLVVSYVSWRINLKTSLSLTWMIGVPLLLAFLCNQDKRLRIIMAVLLVLMSFIAVGISAAIIGYP